MRAALRDTVLHFVPRQQRQQQGDSNIALAGYVACERDNGSCFLMRLVNLIVVFVLFASVIDDDERRRFGLLARSVALRVAAKCRETSQLFLVSYIFFLLRLTNLLFAAPSRRSNTNRSTRSHQSGATKMYHHFFFF